MILSDLMLNVVLNSYVPMNLINSKLLSIAALSYNILNWSLPLLPGHQAYKNYSYDEEETYYVHQHSNNANGVMRIFLEQ